MLTATELTAGNVFQAGLGGPVDAAAPGCRFLDTSQSSSGWPGGQSVDQFIASQLPTRPRTSVDFAIQRMAGSIWSRMSYSSAGAPVEPYDDPTVAYSDLFASVGMNSSALAPQVARRKSILDEVTSEIQALMPSLSGNDKQKLQTHFSQITTIENQLGARVSSQCVKPAQPTLAASPPVVFNASGAEALQDPSTDLDVPFRNQLSQQMLVAAMACDITRVGTIMMAPSRSDMYLPWLANGSIESHHALSHESDSNTAAQNQLVLINQWYASQVSALITQLKAVPENGGTMFDNTVILWGNELGIGNVHTHTNVPWMLAGSAGGYLKTGQAVTLPSGQYNGGPGTPHNRVLVTICQAMGLANVTAFGTAKYCTGGPLTQLMA
jgi:hypothetical protein